MCQLYGECFDNMTCENVGCVLAKAEHLHASIRNVKTFQKVGAAISFRVEISEATTTSKSTVALKMKSNKVKMKLT